GCAYRSRERMCLLAELGEGLQPSGIAAAHRSWHSQGTVELTPGGVPRLRQRRVARHWRRREATSLDRPLAGTKPARSGSGTGTRQSTGSRRLTATRVDVGGSGERPTGKKRQGGAIS